MDRLVLDALDRLIAREPDGVIVVLSDHGVHVAGGDPRSIFDNLIAVRSPGRPGLLGANPTNINVLPTIMRSYLGADLAPLADSQFIGGDDPWLSVREVTPDGP